MDIIKTHLPENCYSKNSMKKIMGAVIHYISAVNVLPEDPFNMEAILNIFKEYKLSAHFLIDRDGTPMELVPLPMTAWHAGRSMMNGRTRCNNFTVGIELVGGKDFEYTPEQIATCKHLLADLMTEYRFPVDSIQGHNAVRSAWNRTFPAKRASVKRDPGMHFPWPEVREALQGVSV